MISVFPARYLFSGGVRYDNVHHKRIESESDAFILRCIVSENDLDKLLLLNTTEKNKVDESASEPSPINLRIAFHVKIQLENDEKPVIDVKQIPIRLTPNAEIPLTNSTFIVHDLDENIPSEKLKITLIATPRHGVIFIPNQGITELGQAFNLSKFQQNAVYQSQISDALSDEETLIDTVAFNVSDEVFVTKFLLTFEISNFPIKRTDDAAKKMPTGVFKAILPLTLPPIPTAAPKVTHLHHFDSISHLPILTAFSSGRNYGVFIEKDHLDADNPQFPALFFSDIIIDIVKPPKHGILTLVRNPLQNTNQFTIPSC